MRTAEDLLNSISKMSNARVKVNSNSNSNLLKQQRAKSHLQVAKTMIKHATYAYYIIIIYVLCKKVKTMMWEEELSDICRKVVVK